MKMKKMKKILCILLCLLLCGCTPQEQDQEAAVNGPQYWEEKPALTYGTMAYEKLEVLPWYGARGEETSGYMLIETEGGYYMLFGANYFYADKTDLSNWVLVCNDPQCAHNTPQCNSRIYMSTILMKEGRIWYEYSASELSELYTGNGNGTLLISAAPDGNERRIEILEEQTMTFSAGSTSGGFAFPRERLVRKGEMQTDGTYSLQWFRFTDSGYQEIYSASQLETAHGMYNTAYRGSGLNGDTCILDAAIDREKFFQIRDGEMVWLDLSNLPVRGSYLSGDTLRIFRSNDGYYDINIQTHEEIKLADAQLENSYATIVLPNCILESTLFSDTNYTPRDYEQQHSMVLFNGESWRSVTLPSELAEAGTNEFLIVYGVTSDSVFLRHHRTAGNLRRIDYYRIDLSAGDLSVEFMGALDAPV